MMAIEKNYLTKASSGKISLTERDREAIATLYLSKMQMIFLAEPHKLCINFFTWISPFTQESVYLPFHEDDGLKQTKYSTFDKFRSELNKSYDWSSLCGMYMEVIDEINGKRNDRKE